MLVLTRKAGEEIVCPELGITIKFIKKHRNGGVQIGIEAPRHLTFHRAEIQQKIERKIPNPVTGGQPAPVRVWASNAAASTSSAEVKSDITGDQIQ